MGNEFEKNHYFPEYNLKYWKEIGSKLYDKKINKDRNFNPSNNFQLHEFYYFDGTPEIEKRLGKIEHYMSQILKKISDSINKKSIELSQYEISFIQLFLFLQASRQLNTTEVIKSDESGIYQSNNFFWGTHNIKTKEAMEKNMLSLINALESIIKKKSSEDLQIWLGMQVGGTHLVIAKNKDNQICQSDVCCIIENDMDSNHLYTYFPQTPNLAFFLVKSKYFYRNWHRLHYLKRTNDTEISPILEQSETGLCCQYEKPGFIEQSTSATFSMAPIDNFSKLKKNRIKLNFFELSNDIVNHYNKILFDDGTIFIHNQKDNYILLLQSLSNDYRRIIVCEPDSETSDAFQNNIFKPMLRVQPHRSSKKNNPIPLSTSQQKDKLEKEFIKILDEIKKKTTLEAMVADGTLGLYTFNSLPSNIFHSFMENISQRQTVELSLTKAISLAEVKAKNLKSLQEHTDEMNDCNNQNHSKINISQPGPSRPDTSQPMVMEVEKESDDNLLNCTTGAVMSYENQGQSAASSSSEISLIEEEQSKPKLSNEKEEELFNDYPNSI